MPNSACSDGAAQVGVDEHDLALELLRHRQRQVRGGDRLALAAARARDHHRAQRRVLFVLRDARADGAVLLRDHRVRRDGRHERRVQDGVCGAPLDDGRAGCATAVATGAATDAGTGAATGTAGSFTG